MIRTLISDLKPAKAESIEVAGWLHKKRLLGGLTFIVVRDRSGIAQVVVQDKDEVEKLKGLYIGTVLTVKGEVVTEERAPGGIEIHNPIIDILVPVTDDPPIEVDKPLSHKPEHLDTLFDNRVIGLRNINEQKVFKIRASLTRYLREFLTKNDFVEVQTPKLVAGAAEGGAEVFKLDYFGKEATLAQSPQLYKQILVGVFERVFEIGPAFRAEPSATTRHVSEVTMLDIEMGFIDSHEEVLNMVQDMAYDALTRINKEHSSDLKDLRAPDLVIKPTFPRYSVTKIHEMYSAANKVDTKGDKDLSPDEERWICNYALENDGCELVFATDLPIEAHKFYQMINPKNPKTVLAADLLFRGVELATCPMREHHYEKLVEQIKSKGIDPSHPGFMYYLQAFKYGLPAHGGCGFGVDRLTEKVIGLNNVKEAILFPRDINRLTP